MSERSPIDEFLARGPHAVIGVSQDRRKFGNKVLRCYLQNRMPVYAVHPTLPEVEGQLCWRSLAELPEPVHGLSIITPPPVTERIVEGRLKKFYTEVCLLEQAFVKNPDQSVRQLLEEAGKKLGQPVRVAGFVRFKLGETATE